MIMNNNPEAFFALLRAGLWEQDVCLLSFGQLNFSEIYRLAEEQSVMGLIAAGFNHVLDTKIPKLELLQFIGATLQMEEHNKAMNYFIGVLINKMRREGIYTLLVKGQGVAQCYERPLWRACGDVDFYLSEDNYKKAKSYLMPLATSVENEDIFRRHLAMTIDPWVVELHGTMYSEISRRVNKCLDEVHHSVFCGGGVRSWQNDSECVFLPSPDNDIIIVFTHYIQHFYVGGIGLRQICDWCRLLWKYRDEIDHHRLEYRLKEMGVMPEWKAFAAFAIDYLGMPDEAMPLYSSAARYHHKAKRICRLILETGNFGHNKDESYRSRYPRLVEKTITFFRRFGEFVRIATIFPGNTPKFFLTYVFRRVKVAV